MMFESKKTYRDSRQDFERHLNLLVELSREGKIRIAEGLTRTVDGISKVRYAPNRRINLATVNEMARNMAMMAADRETMEETND